MVKNLRINHQIRASEVRLIDENEEQVGILSLSEAIKLADEHGVDLVEVAPLSQPPVCKLMDYGKYLYRLNKIEQKHRKKQRQGETKGIRLGLKTESHDLQVKAGQARTFLQNKDTVKVSLVFKGREAAHSQLAQAKMKEFADFLQDVAKVEQIPKRQGNTMLMILVPLH